MMQNQDTQSSVLLEVQQSNLAVKGALNFYNVRSAWLQGIDLMQSLEKVTVDLKELSNSDSSGLALLSAWVRAARSQNKEIVIVNMPSFMQDVSRVCGLEGVLPIVWVN